MAMAVGRNGSQENAAENTDSDLEEEEEEEEVAKAAEEEDEDEEDAAEEGEEEELEDEEEEEEEAEKPPQGRASREAAQEDGAAGGDNIDSGWKGLCSAFNNIMERKLPKPEAPVLCETKVETNLRLQKEEYKEKKLLSQKEKALQDQGHVQPHLSDKEYELNLRRLATKGVVRLFNTVKDFQLRGQDEDAPRYKMPANRRADKMAEAAKDTFDKMWSNRDSKENPRTKRRKVSTSAKGSGDGLDTMAEFG